MLFKKKAFSLILFVLILPLLSQSQSFDEKWAQKINNNGLRSLDKPLNIISNSSDFLAIGIPISMLATGYYKNDASLKRNGYNASVATLSTFGIAYILKKKIDRKRPFEVNPRIKNYKIFLGGSFPSGSTSLAFVSAANLTLAFPKWYVAIPAYTYAAGLGYARMHLGAHYPSDVAAGAIIGTGSAVLSKYLNNYIRNTVRKRKVKNGAE